MNHARKYDTLRVRTCCACGHTVVTPQELAVHKHAYIPKGMKLFAGLFRDRPFCGDCLPAEEVGK